MTDTSKEQALQQLRDGDLAAREAALSLLSEDHRHDPEVTTVLLEVLRQIDITEHGEGYAAADIIRELWVREERGVIPILLEMLGGEFGDDADDHRIPETACELFADMRATDAVPLLRTALFSEQWEFLETEVALALAAIAGSDEEATLNEAVRSPSKEVTMAGLAGLRRIGSARDAGAVRDAVSSDDAEVRQAAMVTLAALERDRSAELIRELAKAASDYPSRSQLVVLVRSVDSPDLSEHLVPLVADDAWRSNRFPILKLLLERDRPETATLLRGIINGADESPWSRGRAAAMLLAIESDDKLVEGLFNLLVHFDQFSDERDNFNFVREAGELMFSTFANVLQSNPRRLLEALLLMDDLRRERVVAHPNFKHTAGAAVRDIVGSDFYSDFDSWVATYRATHGLADVMSPANA